MTGTSRESAAASQKEESLWLLETLVPGCGANNLTVAFQLDGKLPLPTLRRALAAVVRRYPVLRTVYHVHESKLTKIILGTDEFRLEVEQLRSVHQSPEADLTAFAATPFAFNGQALLRAGLLAHEDGDFFCVVFHHLIFDVISGTIFAEEFVAAYEGYPVDSAVAQPVDPFVEPEPRPQSVSFWRDQLGHFDPDGSELWLGTSEVARPTLLGDRITRRLSPTVTKAVEKARKELRCPEAVILLAAYCLLLDGHGAGPDVVVGAPVNVRPPGAERVIGYHVNFLPLVVHVDRTMSVGKLVRCVREVFFDSLVNSDVPVDSLTRALPRSTFARRAMLFRHVFNYLPSFSLPEFDLAGSTARTLLIENGYSKFDLEFFVMSSDGNIEVRTVYRPEIFGQSDIELLLERYEALLLTLIDSTDRPVNEILVWGDQDHAVIEAANRTARTSPGSVLEGFHECVTTAPEQVAIEDGARRVTYRDLWDAACAVRDLLHGHHVKSADVVAVVSKRGAGLAAAVLGIWLADATYLPVDPNHPADRIRYQLADSNARVVITDSEPGEWLDDELSVLAPAPVVGGPHRRRLDELPQVNPAGCAYLIYTSGSTGRPKGTLVSHRALANATAHFADELKVGPGDGALWMTTFAFDISALELFVPLVSGGRVVVAPDEARVDGRVLRDLIGRHEVAVIQATPTTWRTVLSESGEMLRGRKVLCGGEILPVTIAEQLVATGCELHHVYGPTESTIWSTSGAVRGQLSSRLDVGRPIRNTQVMIMDPAERELPLGVAGELCVAGDGVAEGYHNRPSLTADRFREHSRYGRYYRTGDVARWRSDGALELLGRSDRQIKLRGNRIELGEIEAALLQHPDVQAAAVIAAGYPAADARLVAFVEASSSSLSADELWERARAQLARAMVPQEFVIVDALPTNANEKIDYPALAARAAERAAQPAEPLAVREFDDDDEFLALLIALWVELLELEDVTADTNFFTRGGDSLRGAMLAQSLEDQTGIYVPLADLFENPTPHGLAAWIRASGADRGEASR